VRMQKSDELRISKKYKKHPSAYLVATCHDHLPNDLVPWIHLPLVCDRNAPTALDSRGIVSHWTYNLPALESGLTTLASAGVLVAARLNPLVSKCCL
jgi:hypothetical protein